MRFLLCLALVACGARTGTKMNPDDAGMSEDAFVAVPTPTASDASMPPPPALTNSIVVNDCAPNDGPAYDLRIGLPHALFCTPNQMGTFDEITVWKSVPAGFGIVDVTPGMNGEVRTCTNSVCTPALSARIMFTVIISTEVRGTYSIKTANGTRTGNFDAKRCNNTAMCG